jgi:hypothetical protein
MNWGKGLILGMAVFMLFIISMCVYMFRMPADEYDHQYYEKGLNFDRDLAKEKQVAADHAQPAINIEAGQAHITFTKPANGTARFIRPSSQALDKTFELNTNTGSSASLALNGLVAGKWRIVLDWKSGDKAYLYQQEVYIK